MITVEQFVGVTLLLALLIAALIYNIFKFHRALRSMERTANKQRSALASLREKNDELELQWNQAAVLETERLDDWKRDIAERDDWKRRFENLHPVIEGFLGERDQWKEKYLSTVAKHQEGIALVEQGLVHAREMFVKLLRDHNELRKKHGLDPIKGPNDLSDLTRPPVGQVQKFHELMREYSQKARDLVEQDRAFLKDEDEGRLGRLAQIRQEAEAARDDDVDTEAQSV